MILMDPFQLEIFYDSMNTHVAVGIYKQASHAAFPCMDLQSFGAHPLVYNTACHVE